MLRRLISSPGDSAICDVRGRYAKRHLAERLLPTLRCLPSTPVLMPDAPSASAPPPLSQEASDRFRLRDLLSFEKMLTPRLAKVGFYVLSALVILTGVILMFSGMNARFGGGMRVVVGLVTTVVGPFLVRIACEQIIVIFGIYERLGEIRDHQK